MQTVWRADGLERHAGPAQRRLHDAGLLALRGTHGRAESRASRPALSPAAGKDRAADRGAARALRPEISRQCAARQPPARHEATPPARGRGAARTVDPHSRRADVWRRPDRARRLLAHADRPLARRRRDDFRHHPLHERGGPLRPYLAHARRQGARGRRAAGTGQGARQRFARGLLRRLSRRGGRYRHVEKGRAASDRRRRSPGRRAAEALQDWPAMGLRAA